MTERLLGTPRKSREIPPAQHLHMNEFSIIQLRAKQASQFYNSVGLSNGDLPRDASNSRSDRKRLSGSPEKKRPISGSTSQPPTPASTPSKYGATWLEPSKPIISQETEPKTRRLKVLPNKYNLEAKNDSNSNKQRSKSSSIQHEELMLSPIKFRNQTNSASDDLSSQERPRNKLSPRLFRSSASSASDTNKSPQKPDSSNFFKQDLRIYQTNGVENEPPRVFSHLHEKQLSSSNKGVEPKPKPDSSLPYTQPKRFSSEFTPIKTRNISSGMSKKSDAVYSKSPENSSVFTNSTDSTLTPFYLQRQRSLSDKSERTSSAERVTPASSFLHSRKGGSTSSLLDKNQTEPQMDDLIQDYRQNKSCQSSPATKHYKKTKSDSSPIANDTGSPKSFRRHKNKIKSKSDVPDHRVLLDRLHQVQKEKEAQELLSQSDRFEQGQKRRRYFAHYDWQSTLFSFRDALVGMETLKRKNTPSGASKAAALAGGASTDSLVSKGSSTGGSQEDLSGNVDEGFETNKHNAIVDSCPFFRNEIGGETDRNISISASSGLSVQVGNDNNESITEAHNVLPNHSYLSIVERNNSDDLLPPNSPPRGSVSFGIENVDGGASYYRTHFYEKDHQNFFGIDDKLGPIIISFRREKVDDKSSVHQYRIIIRTCELCTLRGSILEDAISPSRNHPPIKGYHAKDVLEYICPEINTSYLKSGLPTPKVHEQIMKIDEQNIHKSYKVGVLYCKAGQTTEDDMYNNEHGSDAFQQFLDLLGTTVKLQGFDGFKGGLDVKTDTTGTESVFTTFQDYNIMFHVSTLLPFTPSNRQQLLRKRHIGNDIATIVFQEPGSQPFNPKHIRSHFQHVFIIVRVHNPCTRNTCYSVAVTRSRNIPRFGPPIPENSMFPHSSTFRHFLLTKVINGENTAHSAGKFKALAMNTREQYLRDLALNQVSPAGMEDTPRLGRFSITAASRRIKEGKEKQKAKPLPELWSQGALTWIVFAKDYSSTETVECLLAVSNCALSVIESASKQLIFSIPCQAVLGWGMPVPTPDQLMSNRRDLHIYYGRGERLSVQTIDGEMREEIEARLEKFTKGTRTNSRHLRRNRIGELGFRVNYEGVVVDLKPDGCAAADGLKQSSRLVEICKIAVATLSSDEMNDLLRTSTVVTVVVIPPNDDGTPRKCSMELYHLYPVLEVKKIDLSLAAPSDNVHKRCRSEPVRAPPVDRSTKPSRLISEDGKFPTPRYQYADQSDINHTKHLYERHGRVKTPKAVITKTPSGTVKATLSPSAKRHAMVGATTGYYHALRLKKAVENGLSQPNHFNSLPSNKGIPGYRNNLLNADWSEGLQNKHTISSNSLSSDSGLNSNNNSSYSSTLSRCSNNATTTSNQQLAFNEILETKFSQQNNGNNNNNNNNNNNSVTTSLEARQTLPRSNPPIRGVLWNPTRTLPNYNVSRTNTQISSSEPYQSTLTPIPAKSDAAENSRSSRTSSQDSSTPQQTSISDANSPAVLKKPVPVPRTFKKTPSPSPRTRISNPQNKRTITDVPPSPGMMESLRSSSTNLSSSFRAPFDVHSTIIRMLSAEKPKTIPSTTSRKSPVRLDSQRLSPNRRILFPTSTPSVPPLQRTVSDESLCGARTDAVQLAGQDSSATLNSCNQSHNRLMSVSVDSLAPSPVRLKKSRDLGSVGAGRSTIHKVSSFPLPAAHNWNQLLDAAKAAEAFEASSIRSVSMGTLNEIYDTPLYNQRGKRTVSVEHLYDHPGRPFFEKSLPPPLSNEEVYPDLVSRSLSKPSQEEERLERIEKKLRQLQKQLQEEQNSKKKLEKEVTSLRRDNTLLLHHVRESNPNLFSKDSKKT